jgi:hypothetical protein
MGARAMTALDMGEKMLRRLLKVVPKTWRANMMFDL